MEKKTSITPPILMVVDIGGSKYMPGFVDGAGQILYSEKREWKGVDPDSIVAQLKEALHAICEKFPEYAEEAKAGGLTIPGFADPVTGVWVESDFLIVKNLPICDILTEEFGIPFYADNDGNACSLAERYFGGAKGLEDFLYLTVSTGIGGAFYLRDELFYGGFWHSGENGLFVMEEYGRPSDTGSVNGVLEMYASGRALAQNYIEAGGKNEINGKTPGGLEIANLAKEGDLPALTAIELEGKYLGRAIANSCALCDFKKVILGGGISLMFDRYKDALYKEFYRILPDSRVEIEATTLGYTGAFIGAAAAAMRGLQGFTRSKGAGNPESVVYRVELSEDHAEAYLVLEGEAYRGWEAEFGKAVLAKTIKEDGRSVNETIKSYPMHELRVQYENGEEGATEKLFALGTQIGKAVAFASVMLDQGKVIIKGEAAVLPPFKEGLADSVKRETYYRGHLPFAIEYEA